MFRRIVFGLVAGMLSAATVFAQAAPAAPAQAPAAPSPFVFPGDAGVILNFVKADKTADFEMVIGKLKEALAKSEKPERKQQAAGWKIFKAAEAGPNSSVVYVSIMDPVVKGADYSVGTLLVEAFGAEGQTIYKAYSDAYGQPAQNILNLTTVV